MSRTVPTPRQAVVMLPSSRRSVLVVVERHDDPTAPDVLVRVSRDDLGEAILELLHAGEAAQWAPALDARDGRDR